MVAAGSITAKTADQRTATGTCLRTATGTTVFDLPQLKRDGFLAGTGCELSPLAKWENDGMVTPCVSSCLRKLAAFLIQ